MRICCITDGLPYPLTSGRLRHYHFLRHLSRAFTIKLVCVTSKDTDPNTREELSKVASDVEIVTMPELDADRRAVRWSARRRLRRQLGQITQSFAADRLLLTWGIPLDSVPFGRVPIAVDFCDAEWPKLVQRARMAKFPESLGLMLRGLRTRMYERSLAARVQHVFFAAAKDGPHVLNGLSTPHTVVPNGIDPNYWKRVGSMRGDKTVLFTGAFSYFPNVDAAIRLATRIFPRIEAEVPGVKLLLVGRDAPPALQALHAPPRVTVTGFVPDVRPYYECASVVVAPLRIAGGIQNKLLEALALELPVVTTDQGISGLGLLPEELARSRCEIVVADTEDALATAAVSVLRKDGPERRPICANRELVLRHFSWERSAERVGAVLQDLGDAPAGAVHV